MYTHVLLYSYDVQVISTALGVFDMELTTWSAPRMKHAQENPVYVECHVQRDESGGEERGGGEGVWNDVGSSCVA